MDDSWLKMRMKKKEIILERTLAYPQSSNPSAISVNMILGFSSTREEPLRSKENTKFIRKPPACISTYHQLQYQREKTSFTT